VFVTKQFADEKPDEVALSDEGGAYTWPEVDEQGNRLIHALRALGLEVGDKVALLSNNRHEYLVVNSACNHSGWLLVPVNWHLVAPEIAYILEDSEAKAIITEPEFLDVAADAVERAGGVDVKIVLPTMDGKDASGNGFASYKELIDGASGDEPEDQSGGGTMFYTSGTTGNPKGVKSSAMQPGQPIENVVATVQGLGGILGLRLGAKTFINSPLYHAGPWAAGAVVGATGGPVVLRRKFDPDDSLRIIQDEKVEQAYFVPTHFVRFLKQADELKDKYDISSLQNVWHTGAPCAPEVKKALIEWWGPVLTEYYGASEGPGSGTMVTSQEWLDKPGTVGKPLPTCEVHILDEEGNAVATGEIGQVWFKNLLGLDFEYSGAPEKTKEAHKEPGFFTYGDVGYLDEDGYLFLSDRKIDMIVSGGVNVYPAEIESVLINHPAVVDVAVFGVPNEEFGEEVKAAVHVAEGTNTKELEVELKKFAQENLAKYKVPRSLDFHEDFPRTPTGKLQKRLLRDPYWEGKERAI
jgi:long-chain acyl-CoA synthetase